MARSFIFALPGKLGTVAVSGHSMTPTYSSGDWLLVLWGTRYRPGQVVVVEREERPGIFLIKRLIKAEAGKYWVEGDNEALSTDSRQWGAIGGEEIRGRVLFRYRRVRQ